MPFFTRIVQQAILRADGPFVEVTTQGQAQINGNKIFAIFTQREQVFGRQRNIQLVRYSRQREQKCRVQLPAILRIFTDGPPQWQGHRYSVLQQSHFSAYSHNTYTSVSFRFFREPYSFITQSNIKSGSKPVIGSNPNVRLHFFAFHFFNCRIRCGVCRR